MLIMIYHFVILHLHRQQAVDEGGIPTFANISEQKYTPGKPHRNAVEFFAAVGSDLWLSNMMWSADKRAKYGTPERKLSQMQAYVRYFREYHSPDLQPHILLHRCSMELTCTDGSHRRESLLRRFIMFGRHETQGVDSVDDEWPQQG